jgi:hypothetical protein
MVIAGPTFVAAALSGPWEQEIPAPRWQRRSDRSGVVLEHPTSAP